METGLEIFGGGVKVNTIEDLRVAAPAVFATDFHPDRTDRYSFLSTIDIIKSMGKLGWNPTFAKQSGTGNHGRHAIRLENESMTDLININGLTPQIVLDNSHNGYSKAQIHMGLFRLLCSNGMVTSIPGMYDNYKFRHVGINENELEKSMAQIIENYATMTPHLQDMMDRDLKKDEKESFAIKAVALREPWRFVDPKDNSILVDKVTSLNNIDSLLTPLRGGDQGEDLWRIFNVIQEKLVNGGYERLSDNGRKSTTRALENTAREVKFNKELWELTETFLAV